NIERILVQRLRRVAFAITYKTIRKRWPHRDDAIERIVILARLELHTFRRLVIAGQEIVDIICPAFLIRREIIERPIGEVLMDRTGFRHERKIGWQRAAIGIACNLLVLEW